jgi:hypothetical protein
MGASAEKRAVEIVASLLREGALLAIHNGGAP